MVHSYSEMLFNNNTKYTVDEPLIYFQVNESSHKEQYTYDYMYVKNVENRQAECANL